MPIKDSVDCVADTSNAINAQRMTSLVDSALSRAGIGKEDRAKVQDSIDDLKYADGQVVAVSTRSSEQLIFVSGPRDGSVLVKFAFPPNTSNFQAELIRAQDTGRVVSVVYKADASGSYILEEICTYAGSATSSPRY